MVPATGEGYGARSMADPRPRRLRLRRALLILGTVTVTTVVSMALGPVLSAERVTGPINQPAPVNAPGGVVREEPGTIHVPATDRPVPPVVAAIPVAPREPNGPSATALTREALQARLDQLRERYGVPGISVTIIFPDGSTWIGVSGLADVEAKTAVTPSTSFAIASVSKTFTAALILALVEDGRIDLDGHVREYLPKLTKVSPKITIRQLLDHTSGLRDYFYHAAIDRMLLAHPDRRWSPAESLKYVGKPYFAPGTGWHYSNTNYLILGLVAEAVGEAPLGDQIRTRLLEPLGLRHTWYQPTESAMAVSARGYRFASGAKDAKPIDLSDGTPVAPFTSVVTAAAGAGALAATSSDLARWARALYAGSVLEPESVQEMLDDMALTERFEPTVPYGLGVQLVDIEGQRSLGHSGRLLGFRSAARWLPDDGIAIAVLTNQSRTDPGIFVRALLKIARQDRGCGVCSDQH
jgi:D-alanyl-D-alanine carboxypeptidase